MNKNLSKKYYIYSVLNDVKLVEVDYETAKQRAEEQRAMINRIDKLRETKQ